MVGITIFIALLPALVLLILWARKVWRDRHASTTTITVAGYDGFPSPPFEATLSSGEVVRVVKVEGQTMTVRRK